MAASAGPEIERLIALLGKLPGLGPRSARRAALALLKRRDQLLTPLSQALADAAAKVRACRTCGALDTSDPCSVCSDPGRDGALICVVEEVGGLWAMERGGAFRGRYHVLGGLLSAMDGVGPDALRVGELVGRVAEGLAREVILALPLLRGNGRRNHRPATSGGCPALPCGRGPAMNGRWPTSDALPCRTCF